MNEKDNSTKSALELLDWDIQPERDLWPDIHSNIRFAGKPKREIDIVPQADPTIAGERSRKVIAWAPMSLAACLMLAFGAFVMSTLSYQRSNEMFEMQASFIEYQKSQISLIEQQHDHVREQFVSLLNGDLGPVDPAVAAEIRAVLWTIDEASLQLKQAMLAEPLNNSYAAMLARTYQEELKLLNKFKSQGGRPPEEVSL